MSDRLVSQTSDAGPPTSLPNWDVDFFRAPTRDNTYKSGGKLNPNAGSVETTEPDSVVGAAVSIASDSSTETGGGGKLKPIGSGSTDGGAKLRPLGGGSLDSDGGGKLRPLGGGSLDSDGGGKLRPLGGGSLDSDGGGKLRPLGGGSLDSDGGGKFRPLGGGKIEKEGGGKLNPVDAAPVKEVDDKPGKLNPSEGGSISGHLSLMQSLSGAAESLQADDFDKTIQSLENAFEAMGVDPKEFKTFGQKLREQLDGFTINAGEGVLTVRRDGNPNGVEFKMDAHLDFNTGRVKAEAKAQAYDWDTKENVQMSPSEALRLKGNTTIRNPHSSIDRRILRLGNR